MNTDNKSSSEKKYAVRLSVFAVIAAVLVVVYFSADDIPSVSDSNAAATVTTPCDANTTAQTTPTEQSVSTDTPSTADSSPEQTISTVTTAPAASVDSSSQTTSNPPETTGTTKTPAAVIPAAKSCSFSISCAAAIKSADKLNAGVLDILPSDGIIFPITDVPLQDGDTVYDVLSRICKQNGIHIETQKVAVTDSVYIEGIADLYEFDAGSLSGWMFSVDGQFPQTSCSAYILTGGERVEILYSCNIGADVGDSYNQR